MGFLTKILLFLAALAGLGLLLDALMAIVYLAMRILLRAADHWGTWMDEHPEREGKKRG